MWYQLRDRRMLPQRSTATGPSQRVAPALPRPTMRGAGGRQERPSEGAWHRGRGPTAALLKPLSARGDQSTEFLPCCASGAHVACAPFLSPRERQLGVDPPSGSRLTVLKRLFCRLPPKPKPPRATALHSRKATPVLGSYGRNCTVSCKVTDKSVTLPTNETNYIQRR